MKIKLTIILAALLVLISGCALQEDEVEVTVNSKERVCNSTDTGGQQCSYLIFTDEGTFQITDSLIHGRFDSSDVYGRIKEDRTYRFKVSGMRIPILSYYPNIIELEEVK